MITFEKATLFIPQEGPELLVLSMRDGVDFEFRKARGTGVDAIRSLGFVEYTEKKLWLTERFDTSVVERVVRIGSNGSEPCVDPLFATVSIGDESTCVFITAEHMGPEDTPTRWRLESKWIAPQWPSEVLSELRSLGLIDYILVEQDTRKARNSSARVGTVKRSLVSLQGFPSVEIDRKLDGAELEAKLPEYRALQAQAVAS